MTTTMMNDPFTSLSVEGYGAALASASSAPGGGSAAALSASLAAALLSMSRSLGCADKNAAAIEALRQALLRLVDEDSAAFLPVTEAWKLPKDDPNRPTVLEKAHATAAETPLKLMTLCGELTALCEQVGRECSQSLLPDVASAAALCIGALCAAAANVRANTYYMKEPASLNAEADRMLREYGGKARGVFAELYGRLEK